MVGMDLREWRAARSARFFSGLGLGLGLVVAANGRHALAAMLARGDDALADEEEDCRDEEDGRDDDGDDDREGRGTRASASVVAAVTVSFGHARQSFTSGRHCAETTMLLRLAPFPIAPSKIRARGALAPLLLAGRASRDEREIDISDAGGRRVRIARTIYRSRLPGRVLMFFVT